MHSLPQNQNQLPQQIEHLSGLHIELTNICTLKCPGCERTQFIDQWPQHWRNHLLDIDQLMSFVDIDLTDQLVHLGGNTGDPVYHPDMLEFVKQFKQRGAHVSIGTNGSYRTQEWWEQLVSVLDADDLITFSIDGTPDNFTQYRINGDWPSIELGLKICAGAAVKTDWKYIPFEYNQDDINTAHQLARDLGVNFYVNPSDRFDSKTQHLVPSAEFLASRYQQQTVWKQYSTVTALAPRCHSNQDHYISAAGYYSPCCYLADHRFYYKNEFGKNRKLYRIQEHTLSEILARPTVIEFYNTLDKQSACQYNCPAT